jgi:hypothetical protein
MEFEEGHSSVLARVGPLRATTVAVDFRPPLDSTKLFDVSRLRLT